MELAASQKLQNLQSSNAKLHAELQVSEKTVLELEKKVETLRVEHESYTGTLLCVNRYARLIHVLRG